MNHIPQMQPFFSSEEKISLMQYMDEGGFITEYKRTEFFEKMIADFTGSKHAIVVNNGTISLTLAAVALNIKYGDDVIVPNYTMIATPNSIKMIGANPIFVDVEKDTLCLDFEALKKAITKKTKAIILVSANGRYPSYSLKNLIEFSNENKIHLIEDAAQSLGSFYPDGMHIGTKGIVGSFSFSAPKIISTGQGGAIITNDDEIAFKIRKLKDFGRTGGGNDIHDSIGFNFKFTELQACIGIEQMKKLNIRIDKKKKIWLRYKEKLKHVTNIKFFDHNLSYTAPWFIDILSKDRNALSEYLKQNNVGTRNMYPPINQQVAYKVKGEYPTSELVGREGLWLPSYVQLTDEEIDYISMKISDFYKKN